MLEVTTVRLYVLRATYLLAAAGLAVTVWPLIIAPPEITTDPRSMSRALLGALGLLSAIGVRYPLRMLPILFFEFVWKLIWLVAFGLRAWLGPGLDKSASQMMVTCLGAVILVPLVIPWGYVITHYIRAPGDPWRSRAPTP
jgi:hypothetical protein